MVVVVKGMDVAPAALLFGIWEQQGCRRIKPVEGEMCHKRGFSDAGFFPPYPHRLSSITSAESV